MVDELKNRGKRVKERILAEARGRVREKAIRRAKSRIALNNRRIEDFSEDQLEALVAEEEETVTRAPLADASRRRPGSVGLQLTCPESAC